MSRPLPILTAATLMLSTALPALAGRTAEATLPILRHQDHDLYYREQFDTLVVGYYGHRTMPVAPMAAFASPRPV